MSLVDRLNETELKLELLKMDLNLRRKQDIWEHPRNIAILVGATATLFAAIFGVLGYKIGQTSAPQPIIITVPEK